MAESRMIIAAQNAMPSHFFAGKRAALACAIVCAAFAAGPLPAAPAAGPRPVPVEAWTRLPPHPRLFATAAQWQELRERMATDAVAARLYAAVRAQAERLLNEPPVALRQRGRGTLSGTMLEPAREVQRRVMFLAATARLSGDARFRDRAWVELRQLADLADWNPAVFLDTAEATLAAAVGYDWLYDELAATEREVLATAIIEKGLRPSFDSPAKLLTWVRGTNNWNQVCHGGLVIGALAVAERDRTLAERVVARAIENLHFSAKAYAPDGVYPEGPTYWSYGTTFHVAMLAALESALGDSFGLDSFPGFLATADYLTQVTAPSGNVFNYADSSLQRGFEPALLWFSRRLKQRIATSGNSDLLAQLRPNSPKMSRFLPLALFWWEPASLERSGTAPPLHWQGRGPVPIAVHRSAWGDPRAVYVAIKGGRAQVSHGHMDAGSFILEADGVRWAVDPGAQNYSTLYKAGIDSGLWRFTQDSPRWSVFRIGADGHNILRFDDVPLRVEGAATMTRFVPAGQWPHTQLDLTGVHAGIKSARRGVALLPDRRIVFQDEWTAGAQGTTASWQWLTHAVVTLEPGAAVLGQSGETLRLRIHEPATATVAVDDTARLLRPHDEPNPGLRRLVVRVPTPAGRSARLVIVAEPGSAATKAEIAIRPLADW